MRVKPEQLKAHLTRALAPVYLVCGDEPLQREESCDAIRAHARGKDYSEREILDVGANFDWDSLWRTTHTASLFAARRVVELRMPTGKPGNDGGEALTTYAARPAPDVILLIICPKLDAQAQSTKWFKSLEQAGVIVQIWPVEARAMPGWIEQRLRARGMLPTVAAVKILAERIEGNLLAAVQDVEKLYLLHGAAPIDIAEVNEAVMDNARFDIYDLADAALAGDALRAARIVHGLRGEGAEPVLVLWALSREIRSLVSMAYEGKKGMGLDAVLSKHRVWEKRKPIIKHALQRHKPSHWQRLLSWCARIDRVIKGAAQGNVWDELLQLSLAMAGVRLWSERLSKPAPK